jgi:bifunctional non-homologous end joining protein LigD
MAKSSQTLEVDGRTLALSNLDKVLYPSTGFTKADAIDYYIRVSPYLLPHLRNRAVTLKRYPDGVEGKFFYEKNCPSHRPEWVETVQIQTEPGGKTISYCLIDSLPALVWAANLASLELHPSLACGTSPEQPTAMVFDLDPGPPANIVLCCQVALWLRTILGSAKLEAWPKTSGSKGLQLYVRVAPGTSFEESKACSKEVANHLVREHPDKTIARMSRNLRAGKVFIDWSQNDIHKTTVCVYSLRAREVPTVSTPVTWEEVERCVREKNPMLLEFTYREILARTTKMGDLFASLASPDQFSLK